MQLLHCYCRGLSSSELLTDSQCKTYLRKRSLAFVLTIVASVSVREALLH
jgi:hypothetical protein